MVVLTFQTKLFNFTMRLFDNSTVHNKICYIGKQKKSLKSFDQRDLYCFALQCENYRTKKKRSS